MDVGELLRQAALHGIACQEFPAIGSAPAFAALAKFLRIPLLQRCHDLAITCERFSSQSVVQNRLNRRDSGTVVAQLTRSAME
jgi:hypothetical protein